MIDKWDLKILSLLTHDARSSSSKIGRRIGRSKQFVSYRIEKLKEFKIIHGYCTDINFRALGYTLFDIFFRLKTANLNMEQ